MNLEPDPLIEVRDLSVFFTTEDKERVDAVKHVSFHVNRGEVLGIVGESGSGKSVSSMSMLRLIPSPPGTIESGEVVFDGKDLLQCPIEELRDIRGKEISVIFQEPMTALSPLQKIGGQMIEVLAVHGETDRDKAWKESVSWLDKVGIPEPEQRMNDYPHQFSGGMRQRVMIAMALMHQPQLIIADEPTTALDVTIQAQIFDLMLDMKAEDTSVLLITHDMGVIWEMCDRVLVMYDGEIVEEGPVEQIFDKPQHAYTEALIRSVPPLHEKLERLPVLEEFVE